MTTRTPRRIAFVTPRYGPHILGGAESQMRYNAERLAQRGHHVEVFSTSVSNLLTWESEAAPRHEAIHGIPVHLYPVRYTNRVRFRELHRRMHDGDALTNDEQLEWLHTGPHSAQLYADLRRRMNDFDLFVCAPNPFPLVHYAAAAVLPRTAIWPCLHDELYAHLLPTRLLLRDAFCIFYNTQIERELAENIVGAPHPRAHVIGSGVDEIAGDPLRFRTTFDIHSPFLLYAGRIEAGKNTPLLINFFEQYKAKTRNDLKLVLIGEGRCSSTSPDVIHLGHQSERTKRDCMAAAVALCQPSVHESLSYVVLESWLAGVPVLVHSDCAVTRKHVVKSGGGFHFDSIEIFRATIAALLSSPALRTRMGASGRRYVRAEYDWSDVLDRLENAFDAFIGC
ncbi:MAG: glycosyltransferase family 4 protein [Chloroflexi bacterium]|nr:glycosyltransferase family 4 protein [Chloroflexota bacterium]